MGVCAADPALQGVLPEFVAAAEPLLRQAAELAKAGAAPLPLQLPPSASPSAPSVDMLGTGASVASSVRADSPPPMALIFPLPSPTWSGGTQTTSTSTTADRDPQQGQLRQPVPPQPQPQQPLVARGRWAEPLAWITRRPQQTAMLLVLGVAQALVFLLLAHAAVGRLAGRAAAAAATAAAGSGAQQAAWWQSPAVAATWQLSLCAAIAVLVGGSRGRRRGRAGRAGRPRASGKREAGQGQMRAAATAVHLGGSACSCKTQRMRC